MAINWHKMPFFCTRCHDKMSINSAQMSSNNHILFDLRCDKCGSVRSTDYPIQNLIDWAVAKDNNLQISPADEKEYDNNFMKEMKIFGEEK